VKRIIPVLLAFIGSAVAAAGLYCAVTFVVCVGWSNPDSHPIAIPVSIAGSFGCLCLFLFVCYSYFRLCVKQRRRWLLLADIACFLLSFFPFFNLWRIVATLIAGG